MEYEYRNEEDVVGRLNEIENQQECPDLFNEKLNYPCCQGFQVLFSSNHTMKHNITLMYNLSQAFYMVWMIQILN